MPPDNRKPPARTGGISEGDQLAGDQLQSIESRSHRGSVPVAEAATVGALLAQRQESGAQVAQQQHRVLDIVTPDDFTDTRCSFVISTASRMLTEGVPVDQVTLPGFVQRLGLLPPRSLLASFLHEMVTAAPVLDSGEWYAAQVVEAAVRRRASTAGHRIATAAEGGALAELRSVLLAELAAVMTALDRAEALSA